MSLLQEEIGVWVAICEKCGERLILDEADDLQEAQELLEEKGWLHSAPETHRFKKNGDRPYFETYQTDLCDCCRTDEPAPEPVRRAIVNRPSAVARGAFDNDPHDEWNKQALYLHMGLAICGHVIPTLRGCEECAQEAMVGRNFSSGLRSVRL